jgi:catechol 2,3-dioxygenase-like lactoylglutathione lyase family enzyme
MSWYGVNHLAMVTPDMDATARFYGEVLQMPLIGTLGNGDPNEPYPYRHYFFSLGGRSTLAFFEWPGIDTGEHPPAGIPEAGQVYDHCSFNVEHVEDLLALRQRLIEHGVEVSEVVDHTVFHSIYFDDPVNGAALEVSCWIRDLHANPYYGDPEPGDVTARLTKGRTPDAVRPGDPTEVVTKALEQAMKSHRQAPGA